MNPFWRLCLASFEKELPPQQFRTWIKPLKCSVDGDSITLTAPNRFVQQWIRDKFARRVEELAVDHFKRAIELKLLLADKDSAERYAPPAPELPAAAKASSREVSRLNPAFTFETFVTGKANELARAAATQVAERAPGATYNPLFVYGGVGLGKTHLIHAIGNHLRNRVPETKIRYIHEIGRAHV